MKHLMITCVVLFSVSATAQFVKAREVLERCAPVADKGFKGALTTELGDSSWCMGYVAALVDTLEITTPAMIEEAYKVNRLCMPEDVVLGDAVMVIVKYLRENPQHLHENGALKCMLALRKAYRCK